MVAWPRVTTEYEALDHEDDLLNEEVTEPLRFRTRHIALEPDVQLIGEVLLEEEEDNKWGTKKKLRNEFKKNGFVNNIS